ncbi:AAA family ATPase [Agrobacterium rhizogenes]|nr:AAA family ATPase [Rhizobium rhizogenes]
MIREVEWFDDLSPVLASSYLIKGLLDRGAMSVIYGPSNSGKTFFALDLAYHVAVSQMWRDRRVINGTTLYLAAEGGNGITNRVIALRRAHGTSNVPLALRRAGLDLLNPDADVQRVIDLAAELSKREPLALIVIDTLSRVLSGGDENGPADMTAFVKNVDRIRHATGAHILIVHHTGKDAAKGARGHSSLRAATDTEIEVSVDGEVRAATVQKQRDYQGGEVFHFELTSIEIGADPDGDPVRTCIVTNSEKPSTSPARAKLTPGEQVALRAIDDALAEHGVRKAGPDYPLSCAVVSTEDWRKHFYRHNNDATPATKRQAFGRACKTLRAKGYIEFYDDHYWRCFDDDKA